MDGTKTVLAEALVDPSTLRAGQLAVDLVYHPRVTRWLARAASAGATTVPGVEVLVHQAAGALGLWLGCERARRPPPRGGRALVTLSPYRSRRHSAGYDVVLAALTCAVAAFGVVMVFSATRNELQSNGLDSHYYLVRQAGYVALGAVVMLAVSRVDYRHYEALATPLYVLSIAALFFVKTPLGSTRSVRSGGSPSARSRSSPPSSRCLR